MFQLYSKLKESEENNRRLECEAKNKKFYTIPDHMKPKGKTDLKTRSESIRSALYGKSNANVDVVLFSKDSLHSICFGMISSTRQQATMKSKNDVAVVVLAHAKARIGLFFRLMCDCLPTRLSCASIKLMMTDTDSIACSIHVPILMRRNINSGKLMFRSNSERDAILSNMGSEKLKAHVELILSGSPEMRRIIDRAHFEEDAVYFGESRKKVVGLYSDKVPLPKMIITFQCSGPKNYQLKKIHIGGEKDGEITSKVKHKGIPQKVEVEESNYSRLLLLWDKQYDINRVAKKYNIEERRTIFINTNNKGDEVFKKKIDKIETGKIVPKTFKSRSFYTTAAGVFMTKTRKRLGVTPSDKVLFPRNHFGSYSVGSRFSS